MFYVFSRSSGRREKRKYGRIVETNPSEKLTVFALMVCTFIIIIIIVPYRLFVRIRVTVLVVVTVYNVISPVIYTMHIQQILDRYTKRLRKLLKLFYSVYSYFLLLYIIYHYRVIWTETAISIVSRCFFFC